MEKKSSGNTVLVSRSVEEPLEATFELGEELTKQSNNLIKPVVLGIIGCIVTILLMIPSIYHIIIQLIDVALGNTVLDRLDLIQLIISSLLILFIISIIFSILLYLIQINKFYKHLFQRYKVVSELKYARLDEKTKNNRKPKIKTKEEKISGSDKHFKNPIFAMVDLVEESMHELPQVIRLLKICKYFIAFVLVFLEINILSGFVFEIGLFAFIGNWEWVFNIILLIIFISAIFLIITSEKLFSFLEIRHEIIDSIRFGERISLIASDPYIIKSGVEKTGWASGKISKKGRSGQAYEFDAYFVGENNLKALSQRLCIPIGKFLIFIKEFKSPITLQSIKKYHEAVIDVCESENAFPLRIIALQSEISELDDKVYDYVLENPVMMKYCSSPVQIVAEDGDVYSFIPQISYGREIG
jgi:hypothetical protein